MDAAKADLMRALGRLGRGLSSLFWTIPLALAADVETARGNWSNSLGALGFAPAFILSGLLWYGLQQMKDFHRQERIWQLALHRAGIFAIINVGLSPFLFWWHRFPAVPFYLVCVDLLAVCGFIFLILINRVLRRLAAMLPDEMLRIETRTFTAMNTCMLSAALGILSIYFVVHHAQNSPSHIDRHYFILETVVEWLGLFMTLMPIAVTLALLWKLKEAILTSFFEIER